MIRGNVAERIKDKEPGEALRLLANYAEYGPKYKFNDHNYGKEESINASIIVTDLAKELYIGGFYDTYHFNLEVVNPNLDNTAKRMYYDVCFSYYHQRLGGVDYKNCEDYEPKKIKLIWNDIFKAVSKGEEIKVDRYFSLNKDIYFRTNITFK